MTDTFHALPDSVTISRADLAERLRRAYTDGRIDGARAARNTEPMFEDKYTEATDDANDDE